ncbi:hypothetical protein [Pedobacter jejuensis]|uniref:Uncharacterized protein n=1 Tax=Pedobacter jejuensis TaxID=1268550 RepID=A0A3N0BVI0_9SPHI|nr:hypothetical protein [Pedobacter jejuensis]RNL53396.1 hypothetical protein D7004_09950 [Pedobacter jejuensis]
MKNYFLIAILCVFCIACKKDIPEPDVVRLQVYSTKIKHTNYNEPDILFWYMRGASKGGYYYMTSTREISDFSDYTFTYSANVPSDLSGKTAIRDIVVQINQLNGEMYYDITGKSSSSLIVN